MPSQCNTCILNFGWAACFTFSVEPKCGVNEARISLSEQLIFSLPASFSLCLLWDLKELLWGEQGVPQEQLGVRCRRCGARSVGKKESQWMPCGLHRVWTCSHSRGASLYGGFSSANLFPTFSISSQFVTIPCSIGYFSVRIPRLLWASSPT